MNFAKGMDNKQLTVTDAQETLNQFPKAKQNQNQNQNQNKNGAGGGNNNSNQAKKNQDNKPKRAKTEESKRSAAHQLLLKGGDNLYSGSGAGFIFAQIATCTPSVAPTSNPFTVGFGNVINHIESELKPKYSMDVTEAEDFALAQNDATIDPMCILLNSQASYNHICNPDLVCNIMKEPNNESITLHCNIGVVMIETIAALPGFGIIWFIACGIANILSLLAIVSDQYWVTLDTAKE